MAVSKSACIDSLIYVASQEIGYLEKRSASDLYSKTGNAGDNNYTKYWVEVASNLQGSYWCAAFVSWCFKKAFGESVAKALLGHWPFVYCPTLYNKTTNKTPIKGSVVLFWNNSLGRASHTGLVVDVTSTTITTIEGNTSAGNTVVRNGGGVAKKTYRKADLNSRNRYFVPDYSIVSKLLVTAPGSKTPAPIVENKSYVGKEIATAVSTGPMNIRSAGSTSGAYIGNISAGTTVKVLSVTSNGWYKIVWTKCEKGYAYVSNSNGKYFKSFTPKRYLGTGVVNVRTSLNFRRSASTSSKIIAKLVKGNTVKILNKVGESWYYVYTKGEYGFVASKYITIK